MKYHLSRDGMPRPCRAVNNCPLSAMPHETFDSPNHARQWAERILETEHHMRTMIAYLPRTCFPRVFHVGGLQHERKRSSQEGEGLSVSVNPDAWTRIAHLGGKTWAIEKATEELNFISWHELSESHRQQVRAWAQARGWMEKQTVYRMTYFDDELDEECYMEFNDESEAREEAEGFDGDVQQVQQWRATVDFPDHRGDGDVTDLALAQYVRDHCPTIDGVWWDDRNDEARLSCPRGVLVHDVNRYSLNAAANG